MSNIDNFIKNNSVRLGGIKVFTSENAEKIVDMLFENKKKILGVDGIFVTKEGNRPSMEDSLAVDEMYGASMPVEEVRLKILKFIQGRANKKELFFEIVF